MQTQQRLSKLISIIQDLPEKPGVYLFKDEAGQVLYIGKAKNIKSRVRQHCNTGHSWKSATIISQSSSLDYIVTKTELAALLLEARLIQNHQPKHNILLKTGQPFIYLMITKGEIPLLSIARNKKKKGEYFGPFIDRNAARRVFNFLTRTFRLKLCTRKIEQGCLYYHLNQCAGSCRSDFDKDGYVRRLNLAISSLKKDRHEFLRELEELLMLSNQNLTFEYSQELADTIEHFKRIHAGIRAYSDSQSLTKLMITRDIWIYEKNNLSLFQEYEGIMKHRYTFYTLEEEPLINYMLAYYRTHHASGQILTHFKLEEKKLLQDFLDVWSEKKRVHTILHPREGHLLNLVNLARATAHNQHQGTSSTPKAIQKLLKLTKPIHTIDCFDISHKQGQNQVGSCIRFVDGEPYKNKFRRFIIKTIDTQNDYACLREIVRRRYRDGDFPDLILIDGGKGQLNAVKDLDKDVAYASLAKREETVFVPHLVEGKKLSLQSHVGQLLTKIRDYTHHFAITFHRKKGDIKAVDT